MINQKREKTWFKFSTPAIIAAFYLSLQFLIEFLVAFFLYMIQLTDDIVMSRLLVLLISQIICTAIFIVIVIPFLKIKDVEFNSISYTSLITFIAVFCLFWAILISITLGLSVISNNLGLEADIFRNILPIPKDHSGNLFAIIIWLLAGTLGVAIFLEYLYRRTLIPLLEKCGMSPFSAVLTSSCAFALVNIPFNLGFQITFLRESNLLNIYLSRYNLVNSIFYSLNLFSFAFLLGMACGIVYILTRNIIFSIMIHCCGLLPYYLMELIKDNVMLISFFYVLIITINISGLFIALYTIHSYFNASSQIKWIAIVKEKSSVDIKYGLIRFFIIFIEIVIYISVFLGLLAEHAPIMVTILFHILFLGFCFRNLRKDSLRSQSEADYHEFKVSSDVS